MNEDAEFLGNLYEGLGRQFIKELHRLRDVDRRNTELQRVNTSYVNRIRELEARLKEREGK